MKLKLYRFLECAAIVLLITSMFLPWLHCYGEVENAWADYNLSAITMHIETISLWRGASGGILNPSIPIVIIMLVLMTLCAIIPYITVLLLTLSGIFTCIAGTNERNIGQSRALINWAKATLMVEAVLVVTAYIVYSLRISDLLHLSWGIAVSLALLIPEAIIRKKLTDEEKNERRRVIKRSQGV